MFEALLPCKAKRILNDRADGLAFLRGDCFEFSGKVGGKGNGLLDGGSYRESSSEKKSYYRLL